ncbi:uncharacterized protein BYT42DRAFT_501383 [Radiomyces spectabilis]|uniref:uncharacterized protein n=1 Tax=Radiomyces spectabilis TaxID=64574 RepID=UPI00222015F0|nr:uncharacterized protein BYT42DRAFT_501383 [Radiomyces spectabilis]KAI8371394.1 hypothetical protein BYT42DRAFT_501383 [Radiomyces spectabilis]
MKKSSSSGVKLAPAIHHATVVCFERRNDQKMWYIIQVDPQPSDIRMVPGRPNPQSIARQPYTIARRYEDFTHFAQLLHDTFTSSKLNNMARRAGSQWRNNNAPIVLPKIKSRFNLLPNKQLHVQRRTELDKFVQTLFKLPSFITQSLVVLEFFGEDKLLPSSSSSRWKRLRYTSFRPKPPAALTPSASLSSLCTQAANKIMPWTCRSRASQSTFATSATPSPTISPTLRMIKLKVIYDFDNIIVIQVSRCISLDELRTRIVQKFSDPSMGAIQLQKNFVLLFNDARSSASTHYARHQESGASLISKQQDLAHLMQTKWSRVEKVTLRCII